MDVALSPANPLVGYVTLLGFDQNTPGFPGHVFQITCTANCATSALVDKTGNLPNIPADSILPNPLFPQQVFVGTDWGLFFTNDINANPPTWQRFQAGLPNVMIWDIEVDRGATTLSVWTRARGAYAWPLPSAPIILPTATPSVTGTPPTATRTAVVTPSATATPGPCFNYTITTGTSTVISGTQDIGNHCDDCATTVQLPFPVTFYDQTFTQGYATSNGTFMFGPATAGGSYNTCLPDRNDTYAIKLYGADLDTRLAGCAACGIFTTTLGTAPNRQFVLQWHAVNFGAPGAPSDFDLIFTEGSSTVSAIYGVTSDGGAGEVVGVEQSATTGRFTQYSCNTASLTPGLRIDYHLQSCATPSPTVTATPTSCPVQFVDVPANNTFYAFIRCLACRGIVGGYPCGGPGEPCPGTYYRPNANVTRGQTAKIVSESAGFADVIPSTQQTFQDVTPGSTFYLTIERMASRGIISGYPCGGVGEPCVAPTNRPYFRPNNSATRGQMSKIAASAFFPNCSTPQRK